MKTMGIAITLVGSLVIVSPTYRSCADGGNKSAQSYYQEAQEAYEQDDFDEASDLMKKALKLDPENCEYHWVRGNIQSVRAQKGSIFTKIGKAKSCKKHWEQAVELCPDSIKYLEGLMYFNLQAPGIAGGDKGEARKLLQRVYALDSTRGDLARAEFASFDEDYETAKGIYDRLLAAGRDTLDVLRGLGNLYNFHLEEYSRAHPYYMRVLAAEPEDWQTVYQAARTSVLSEASTSETIELFRHYLAHPAEKNLPVHAAAYWRLGMAYEQLDYPDSAFACYKASLKLEPDYKRAGEALKELKKKTGR